MALTVYHVQDCAKPAEKHQRIKALQHITIQASPVVTRERASRRLTSSGEYASVCIAHLRSDSPRDGQQNPTASIEQYSISKRPHIGCLMYKQYSGAFLHLRQKIEDPLMMHSASSFCSSTSRPSSVSVIIPAEV